MRRPSPDHRAHRTERGVVTPGPGSVHRAVRRSRPAGTAGLRVVRRFGAAVSAVASAAGLRVVRRFGAAVSAVDSTSAVAVPVPAEAAEAGGAGLRVVRRFGAAVWPWPRRRLWRSPWPWMPRRRPACASSGASGRPSRPWPRRRLWPRHLRRMSAPTDPGMACSPPGRGASPRARAVPRSTARRPARCRLAGRRHRDRVARVIRAALARAGRRCARSRPDTG